MININFDKDTEEHGVLTVSSASGTAIYDIYGDTNAKMKDSAEELVIYLEADPKEIIWNFTLPE